MQLAREVLGLPGDRDWALLISLGYPADRPLAPIKNPKRRPFSEVVHRGRFRDRNLTSERVLPAIALIPPRRAETPEGRTATRPATLHAERHRVTASAKDRGLEGRSAVPLAERRDHRELGERPRGGHSVPVEVLIALVQELLANHMPG